MSDLKRRQPGKGRRKEPSNRVWFSCQVRLEEEAKGENGQRGHQQDIIVPTLLRGKLSLRKAKEFIQMDTRV